MNEREKERERERERVGQTDSINKMSLVSNEKGLRGLCD